LIDAVKVNRGDPNYERKRSPTVPTRQFLDLDQWLFLHQSIPLVDRGVPPQFPRLDAMNWTMEAAPGKRSGNLNAWFDSMHYQRLYGHRDHVEAANFIDALIRRLRPKPGSSVLDVACGVGRHSKHLAAKGFCVTGFDLAAEAVNQARHAERPGLRFFRHDMRLPFGKYRFDYVFNFFTSFGYFESPAEHFAVIQNMTDSLTANGTLVIDYLNVYCAEAHLVPHEVKRINDFVYRLTRWSDRDHIFKKIVVEPASPYEPCEYQERVAKFTLLDFQHMFARSGLSIHEVYGDYALSPYEMFASPRLILIAHRVAASQRLEANADNPPLGGASGPVPLTATS
jgi:SAM-dependent methyltransferase